MADLITSAEPRERPAATLRSSLAGVSQAALRGAPHGASDSVPQAQSTTASTTAEINASLPGIQLGTQAAPPEDSVTSDARISYIRLSSPGNQEVLPVNSILTGIDVELTMVQIAMPQARLQGHDLGKSPKGIGPWMVSVTQEACEYLVNEAELIITSPMGTDVFFQITECD